MKAILIDAENREVREVEVSSWKDYAPLIKCDCFTVAMYFGDETEERSQNVIYVDDEGLLTDPKHFFVFEGGHQPFAGNGLILGTDHEGETIEPSIILKEAQDKVRYLNPFEALIVSKFKDKCLF
jgi:hypothetical protein